MNNRREPGSGFLGVDWTRVWGTKGMPVIVGVAGLVLVSAGFLTFLIFQGKEPEIEILPVDQAELGSTIWIDLEGAVEKPGVYELPGGSRLNDLLIRAGGLAAKADREWAAKTLNLARKLEDGEKVYIPASNEAIQGSTGGEVAGLGSTAVGKINLNTASTAQLDSLWGIGVKRAEDIIQNRPYASVEELLNKKIIPANVYERIKGEIAVY